MIRAFLRSLWPRPRKVLPTVRCGACDSKLYQCDGSVQDVAKWCKRCGTSTPWEVCDRCTDHMIRQYYAVLEALGPHDANDGDPAAVVRRLVRQHGERRLA